jgi:phosphatidate cytidylyltransferase
MALNRQAFKIRALTAIFFVVVMLVGLLWNQWSFIILFTIIHFGCWFEFVKLVKKIKHEKFGYYLPLGLLYITMPVVMMIYIRAGFFYSGGYISHTLLKILPLMIILSIWINDTMAYVVGSLIGKTPLSKISPKKTWEGTVGGAIFCVIIIALLQKLLGISGWIMIPTICAIFGTLGDLLESKLKRMANVKDSGSILPGHGGFLDRFDSFLIATPFVWLYVYFFMR